jgi:hypothetical protein
MNSYLWLAIILVLLWLGARVFLAVTAAMLHLLWIIALILLLVWVVRKFTR